MFVGDSIQRTQWESMVCLIQSAIPDSKKFVHKDPPRKLFVAEVIRLVLLLHLLRVNLIARLLLLLVHG